MESLIVPEVTLYRLINKIIDYVHDNWNSATDKKSTILYRLWNGVEDGTKYKYYEQSVSLFANRRSDNPRKVSCRLFFDREQAGIPTVHITMPSDQVGENSIGIDESGYESEIFTNTKSGEYTITKGRRFDSQFYIVCTSDNAKETLLIYHTLRAAIISAWETLEFSGLQNLKISGQEMRIKEDLAPPHIFMRGIGLMTSFDVRVPDVFDKKIINQIILKQGEIINPISND